MKHTSGILPRPGSTRAMTLVELIISMAMITLLMGAFMWMLLAGRSMYQSAATSSTISQDAQIFISRLREEMRESDCSSITYQNNVKRTAISLVSARDREGNYVTGDSGAPVWQKYIIYYCPGTSTTLKRREVYRKYSGRLLAATMALYCNGEGTVITRSLDTLTCKVQKNPSLCTLTMILAAVNDRGNADEQTWYTTFYLRN